MRPLSHKTADGGRKRQPFHASRRLPTMLVQLRLVGQYDAYYRAMDKQGRPEWNAEQGIEGRKRLVQMDWLLYEIQRRELECARTSDRQVERAHDLMNEVELLTESFYWIAGRTRGLVRCLPGLREFECPGVRNVRNKLLEHPEGADSQIFSASFALGGENGPVLKAMRPSDTPVAWPDAGLYANAREFAANLQSLLRPYFEAEYDPPSTR